MGYYSYFTLSCYDERGREVEYLNIPSIHEKFVNALHEINPRYFDENEGLNYFFSDSRKWYDHTKDMIALSKRFPEYVFVLEGEGEERDDNWRAFYHNGETEVTHAQIIYPRPTTFFGRSVEHHFMDLEDI